MDELFALLHTTEEARRVSSEIDVLLASFSKAKSEPLSDLLKKTVSQNAQEFFQKALLVGSATKQREFLLRLKEKLASPVVLSLTIAFEPTEETITGFSNWVKSNIAPEVLLDIHFDIFIVGGAIIEFGGMYRDYTLKKKMEELFTNKKEQILAVL